MGIDEHVKLLGGLLVLFGILAIVVAVVALLIVGNPFALIGDVAQTATGRDIQSLVLQIYVAIAIPLTAVVAIPSILTGVGLRGFRPWSRDVAMITCTLLAALVPLGTILAIYGFYVVLSPEVEPLFSPREE